MLSGTTEAETQYNKTELAGAERSVTALAQRPVMLRAASCYALGSRPPKIVVAISSELCQDRGDSISTVHVICNDPHTDSTSVAASRVHAIKYDLATVILYHCFSLCPFYINYRVYIIPYGHLFEEFTKNVNFTFYVKFTAKSCRKK